MPRFRNTSGQVLVSLDFGVIGPNELVAEHYDPELHGVIPGCTPVEDPPEDDGSGEAESAPADGQPARKRRSAAGQDKETTE